MRNIYEKAVELMQPEDIDHHGTDLYLKANDISKKLLKDYEFRFNCELFRSPIDNKLWYDIPFAYTPGWNLKNRWPYV